MTESKRDGRATLEDIFAASRSPDLTPQELRLWLIVRSLQVPDGCYAATETLAGMLGRSARQLERLRSGLRSKGWLELQFRGPNEPRLYAIVPPEAPSNTSDLESEAPTIMTEQGGAGTGEAPTETTEQAPTPVTEQRESSDTTPDMDVGQSTGVRETTSLSPPSDASPPKRDVREEGSSRGEDSPALGAHDRPPRDAPFSLWADVTARGRLEEIVRREWWSGSTPPARGRAMRDEVELLGRFERRPENGDPPDLSRIEAFVRGFRRLVDRGDRIAGAGPGDAFSGVLVAKALDSDPGLFDEALSADDFVGEDARRDAILERVLEAADDDG